MKKARPYNRNAALDAALTLFWKKGYHATSLKDLESALNMKPGSIYAAFSSKEALFGLALERYFEKNCDAFMSTIAEAESPLSGLAEFLRNMGRIQPDDPQISACMLVKTLLNATPEETGISAQAGKYLDQMENAMASAFEKAKQAGELAGDADAKWLARRYQSDLTALRIEAARGIRPDELVRSAEEMARRIEDLRLSAH